MKKIISVAFSGKPFVPDPLGHINLKKPVYLRLFELLEKEGFLALILTRKTFRAKTGDFEGGWYFGNGGFTWREGIIKPDLVYDRVGGVSFPPEDPKGVLYVNRRDFKILAWDKWATYKKLKKWMPETFWVGDLNRAAKLFAEIKTEKVVVKPFNSLEGKDIYIGEKENFSSFKPERPNRKFILQEFVDTSGGILGVTSGLHDLRVVVINNEVVWCHVRTPAFGKLLANRAQGGTLTELSYAQVPGSVKKVVEEIALEFYRKYDNPIFSLDFGIDQKGTPQIFEINDQIGFPRWEMKNRDTFLNALIENFKTKLS